jgi:hypothetical protein
MGDVMSGFVFAAVLFAAAIVFGNLGLKDGIDNPMSAIIHLGISWAAAVFLVYIMTFYINLIWVPLVAALIITAVYGFVGFKILFPEKVTALRIFLRKRARA